MNMSYSRNTLIFVLITLFLINSANAQQNEYSIGDKRYRFENGKWYTFFSSKIGDEIIPYRLVVKSKNNVTLKNSNFVNMGISGIKLNGKNFLNGFHVLSIDRNSDPFKIASELEKSKMFDLIEFDAYGKRTDEPNDPNYEDQWELPLINAVGAWDITTGSGSIILAVIDSGTDYDHEDLDGNIWINPNEAAGDANSDGYPGIHYVDDDGDGLIDEDSEGNEYGDPEYMNDLTNDDDENGYNDDFVGWDFAGGDNNPQDPYQPDNDPDDTDGHGTSVSGIAVAQTNNYENNEYVGVAGIAGGWGAQEGVNLMVLRDGGIDPIYTLTAKAITYAAENGAKIINISSSFSQDYAVVKEAINNAVNNYDVIIVTSAGNNGATQDPSIYYPAKYSNTIAVGASNENDVRRNISAYGSELDVVAPSNIPSTAINNGYTDDFGGTSSASPVVAGFASLLRSYNSNLTWDDVRNYIRHSSIKVDGMSGQSFNNYYGYGRVNINNGLLLSLATANKSVSPTAISHNGSRKIEIDGTSYQYRHLVFSSGGEIFYKRRPVWTSIWGETVLLSNTTTGNNDYPCISVQDNSKVIVTWQRKVSSSSYEIWIAKSDNNGVSWDQSYELTTISASTDPLPVVSADGDGTYFELVFGRSSGLRGYTSNDGETWYGTTFSGSNNSGDKNPSLAAESLGKTGMVYETDSKKIYYRYRISYLGAGYPYYWISPFDLTTIIPGSNYSHVTPSLAYGDTGEHVVWHRIYGSGSSIYYHSLIYRYKDVFGWQNEYTALYYQNQQNPVITETDDYIWVYFQLITDDDIYRHKFNGYSWSGPEYVAEGRSPSISAGKASALPIWTANSSSPYEIKVASTTLTKTSAKEVDPRDYYKRSIAVLDCTGNFVEVVLNNIIIKKYDGSDVRIPLNMSRLEDKNISTSNCWDLQTSEYITVPENAESLFVNYEIKTSGYDKLLKNPLDYQKIRINIDNQNKTNLISKKEIDLSEKYKNISEVRTSKQYVSNLSGQNIKVSLSIEDSDFNKNTFASLGHIYDYNNLDLQKESIVYAELDTSEITEENGSNSELSLSPNPFNSQVKIEFSLLESQQVNLTIYNLNGQLVRTIVNEFLNKGNHSFSFNGNNLSSGIYFADLKTKSKRIVKRLLLIK